MQPTLWVCNKWWHHHIQIYSFQNHDVYVPNNRCIWITDMIYIKVWPYFTLVDCVWNVMAHVQKPDFVFRRNGRVHLNQQGRQFSRLLAAEMCAAAVVMVVMLAMPCSKVAWTVLATHSIRQFPLHFPSCASPCAITFQLDSTTFNDSFWSSLPNVYDMLVKKKNGMLMF